MHNRSIGTDPQHGRLPVGRIGLQLRRVRHEHLWKWGAAGGHASINQSINQSSESSINAAIYPSNWLPDMEKNPYLPQVRARRGLRRGQDGRGRPQRLCRPGREHDGPDRSCADISRGIGQ